PADLVHLVVRREFSREGAHPPVPDDLRSALGVAVARLPELLEQLATKAGLLLDLAQRARLVALGAVALSLREAPVVVLRPVPEQHHPVPHARAARRPDEPQIALRSFFHAFGHAARISARRVSSRSMRRPAASAWSGGASAASSRSRSAATTASWCSPRT